MDLEEFSGRVALVTGAGSGLGYEYATALARLGAKVVVNDVRTQHGGSPEEATAEEVAAQLTAEGFFATADMGDIGNEEYAVGLVERAVKQHGRIDILINNAGMIAPGTAYNTDTAWLMQTLGVNFFGSFWTQRTALGHMREQNYGRIVNTASGAGLFGKRDSLSYMVGKMAVQAISKSAALDTEDLDIKVNAICPLARTVMAREFWDMRPHVDKDSVHPNVVAAVVLYLVSENCILSGETISAGAGHWARIFSAKTKGSAAVADPLKVPVMLDEIIDVSDFKIFHVAEDQYDD